MEPQWKEALLYCSTSMALMYIDAHVQADVHVRLAVASICCTWPHLPQGSSEAFALSHTNKSINEHCMASETVHFTTTVPQL